MNANTSSLTSFSAIMSESPGADVKTQPLTKGVHCQRTVSKVSTAKSIPTNPITGYIKSRARKVWKLIVSMFRSNRSTPNHLSQARDQKTSYPDNPPMSTTSDQVWSPRLKTKISIPNEKKDPVGHKLALKAFIKTDAELIELRKAELKQELDNLTAGLKDWTEIRKGETGQNFEKRVKRNFNVNANKLRAQAEKQYGEHVKKSAKYITTPAAHRSPKG